jgi:COMPASS component SWD3
VSGGKEVASLTGHTEYVSSVAFSPDGQHIVSGSGDLVKVWS